MSTTVPVSGRHSAGAVLRPGVDPDTVVGKPAPPPLRHEIVTVDGMEIERDAAIELRDGIRIYVDIYRPQSPDGPVPALLAWGPYGKHWTTDRMFPGSGVDPEWISPYTGFESPDPVYWTSHGYAVAVADPRGLWNSEGDFSHNGPQERDDLYDAIEWLGAQRWCSGRIGMLGVSYLAGSQYQAASARPPSLKAISPWECFSDWYREFATHGGIPETGFRPRVATNLSYGRGRTEDPAASMWAHPLDDDYYSHKYGDLSDIDVPAYVVASWSDHGLHTRGTLNAFDELSSEHKWLEVHGGKKWAHFYRPESVERQRTFFDAFLKEQRAGIESWPTVRLEVRDSEEESSWRSLDEPPCRPAPRALHLDFSDRSLREEPPAEVASATFDSLTGAIDLSITFDERTELIGPASLTLWLAAEDATDADVFVVLRKFRVDGTEVRFPINSLFSDGPVAMGWLRASHREVDPARSSPLVPFHPHQREVPLTRGEPACLDIEIWSSGTVFHAGERLVLTLQGHDFIKRSPQAGVPPLQILHESLRNAGRWTLRSGPSFKSVLRLPS